MVSIKEVAERAGVSVATAYKAFNSDYSTGTDIRERVLKAAGELAYVHKPSATRRKLVRSNVIALIIADSASSNRFYNNIIHELTIELDRFGYRLIVLFTEKDTVSEQEALRTMVERNVDGIILLPLSPAPLEEVNQLLREGMPLLQLFDRLYPEMDTLLFDDVLGTQLATRHLIQCGHRRIALYTRNGRHNRRAGYVNAFQEAGLPVEEALLLEFLYDKSVKETIKQHISQQKPTAIITVSEGITTSVLQSLREMSLSMPEDMSIIAYDDFPWMASIGISAVTHPFDTLGNQATRLILSQIASREAGHGAPPSTLVLDPMLVIRESIKILR
jgi:DNA-binding LacI/PurR family transcriptional regulator